MVIPQSDRLSYVLMGAEDADLLFELDQDIEVMRYINGGKMTSREDIQQVFLPRMASYSNSEKGWGLWKVMLSESDEFIGWILVRPMDFFSEKPQWDNLELGWRFMQKAWGHGYATEAASAIMHKLSERGLAKQFSAIAMPGNQASIQIMKKLGMTYLKTDINKDPLGDVEVVYYQTSV